MENKVRDTLSECLWTIMKVLGRGQKNNKKKRESVLGHVFGSGHKLGKTENKNLSGG